MIPSVMSHLDTQMIMKKEYWLLKRMITISYYLDYLISQMRIIVLSETQMGQLNMSLIQFWPTKRRKGDDVLIDQINDSNTEQS